jgi:hypothetical protein
MTGCSTLLGVRSFDDLSKQIRSGERERDVTVLLLLHCHHLCSGHLEPGTFRIVA